MQFYMLLLFFFSFIIKTFGESCDNWNDKYICEDNEDFSFDSEWDNRGFQTPPRNDIYGRYRESYKDMHYIVGYAQLKYSSDKNTCTIKIITRVNPKLGIEGQDYYIHYIFGDIEQESDTITITSDNHNYKDGMLIMAKIMDIRRNVELVRLELEEEYFMWDNPKINQTSHYENGQKGGIVELFGWPYEDIELECEFLSHAGYLGLKIYSPNEHIIYYNNVEEEMLNPWWYITQPVSYKFISRMGNKKQLKKMINTCRSYNLRIYADIIVNHMTSDGTDMYEDHRSGDGTNCNHWSEKDSTGGSPFWTTGFRYENNTYTGLEPGLEYPAVPYFPSDFHCKSTITNWGDPDELDGGWLNGLADLNTEKEYVQQRISDYYVELLSLGFSGISIANSKHIAPKRHAQIFKKLKNNLGGVFPEDFFAIIQLQYGGEKQILMCESNKRINFGDFFIRKLKDEGLSDEEILKIKIWNSEYPEETPYCDGDLKIAPERYTLSIENPDDINLNSYYYSYIRDKNIEAHRSRTMNMFNNNDIHLNNLKIKSIFSFFSLINHSKGFPDGKSDCKKCKSEICRRYCTKSFPYSKAYKPLSQGYDTGDYSNWIEGTYTRVHRDLQIINSMREWMNLPTMTEDELYEGERRRADCNEECLICNDESKSKNMCLICDISKGFYPVIAPGQEQKYFECFNSAMKYERFYFNETEEAFKPCYESCKECDREGNGETHNCLKCDVDLIERPDKDSNGLYKNCVVNCSFNYNITLYGQYKCLEKAQCNANEKYYIKDKNKCIDNCKNDDTYQYTYNGECLKECPVNTIENNFLCKNKRESINYDFGEYSILVNDSECSLSQKEILLSNFQEDGEMSDIVMSYINQFHYRKRHVLQLNNSKYKIVIYRDKNCINELSINIPNIDFGECYEKALETLDNKDDIIIVYAEKTNIENPNSTYSLYDSKTGKKIYGESLCKDSWILIEKNLTVFKNQKLFNDEELLKLFVDKSIDFFNLSDPFFIDICYNFDSPKKKDIPLRERILLFYPNITLCDIGCIFKGIDLSSLTCKCLCKFNDLINNDIIQDALYLDKNLEELLEMAQNSNLEVLNCFIYIFKFKYFKKSVGGLIVLISIFICIVLTLLFYLRDLKITTLYILELTQNYITYVSDKSTITELKNKDLSFSRKNLVIPFNIKDNEKTIKDPNLKINLEEKIDSPKDEMRNKKIVTRQIKTENITVSKNCLSSKEDIFKKKFNIENNRINIFDKHKEKITEKKFQKDFFSDYLSISLDDLDFEDSMKKDKRKFCEYLINSIVDKQLIINTFYSYEPFRPISIKLLLLDISIILYFTINALFYSEEYITKMYHTENERFFTFFPRSIKKFVYTTVVNIIIGLFIECFFVEEKKLKGIFIREKEYATIIRSETLRMVKKIKERLLSFIILIFVLSLFCYYYLSCFNYVYPYTQIDWIKSSVFIIIIMQVLPILASLIETSLRFVSFKCKSEKLFRISKLLN